MNISLSHIQQVLQYRQRKILAGEGTPAAVLMPLVRSDDSINVLLTKRTDDVEHHKGQISFPGGMTDPLDESSITTALRETEEEIGLSRTRISILGMMDDIHLPSGFIVTPAVGYVETLQPLTINKDEVAEILLIPIEKFLDCSLRRSEFREVRGVQREVFFYNVWKEPVWGATAAIIKQFTDIFLHDELFNIESSRQQ